MACDDHDKKKIVLTNNIYSENVTFLVVVFTVGINLNVPIHKGN